MTKCLCGAWQLYDNECRAFENDCIVAICRLPGKSTTVLNCVSVNETQDFLSSIMFDMFFKFIKTIKSLLHSRAVQTPVILAPAPGPAPAVKTPGPAPARNF